MKTKKKGFTLIEMIIVLAVFLIVMTVAYLFFMTNTKIVASTEIKSELQQQGEEIQQLLIEKITQSRRVVYLTLVNGTPITNYQDIYGVQGGNPISLGKIIFEVYEGETAGAYNKYWYEFQKDTNGLYFKKVNVETLVNNEADAINNIDWTIDNNWKCIGKNVNDIRVLPVDYGNFTTDAERSNREIDKINALSINISLYKKSGFSEKDYSIKSIVEFRNYWLERNGEGDI